MTGDRATLTRLQLADSLLPVGGYSCSYALEQFVQTGRVEDGDDLEALLSTYLRRQVGPGELVALRWAHRGGESGAVEEIVAADRRLHAATLPAEFRESATRSGARLCQLWGDIRDQPLLDEYVARDPPQHYPVVLGAVSSFEGINERRACLLHGYSFCSDMLGAAQRLLSLGHTEAQRVIEALKPVVVEAVEASAGRTIEDLETFAPLVDVRAAEHERAQRRLFVS